jgi:CDGSH-type Zn-finger protein
MKQKTCQCGINERCPQCDRRVKYSGDDATWEAHQARTRAYQRAYYRRRTQARKLVERLNHATQQTQS